MTSLFKTAKTSKPLADQIRPTTIAEIFGREHLFADNSQIKQMINSGHIQNIIFWGPSGSGKTTLARILAKESKYHMESIPTVVNGVQEIKQIFSDARNRKILGINTLLIADEIHHLALLI